MESIIPVEGMACEHCVKAITKAVGALPGVGGVSADLKAKTVTVEYDPAQSLLSNIKREIEEQGYDVVA
jgi:copper chaperone